MSIYFLADTKGRIKIGWSRAVSNRQRNLSTIFGPLECLGTTPGARRTEQKIHERFHAYRLDGEWFRDCDELRAAIAELCQQDLSTKQERDWAAQEAAANSMLVDLYDDAERYCLNRGMKSGEAMAYIAQTYSIPHDQLWSLRYRQGATPNLSLYFALRRAKFAEMAKMCRHIATGISDIDAGMAAEALAIAAKAEDQSAVQH